MYWSSFVSHIDDGSTESRPTFGAKHIAKIKLSEPLFVLEGLAVFDQDMAQLDQNGRK